MKKIIATILCASLLLSFAVGCMNSATSESTQNIEIQGDAHMLDGKKVIFIGNSFTYYGKCVLERSQTDYDLDKRKNDAGYFYRICKENGAEVAVTNFTFGAHTLKDFYSGNCQANRGHNGLNHLDYLTDRNYDYVILQNGSRSSEHPSILDECEPLMKLFREANPNVKFVFLVHRNVHSTPYTWRSSIKDLADNGFTVVDWGAVVDDIITGKVQVPGATQTYNKNSFIINKSESDGFHPNMLTGYITALMTYCAITGESAQGQIYNFGEGDITFGTAAVSTYRSKMYTYEPVTNFDAILKSEADIRGIQQLIDQYLADKAYLNY